jgi:hypothetical protein
MVLTFKKFSKNFIFEIDFHLKQKHFSFKIYIVFKKFHQVFFLFFGNFIQFLFIELKKKIKKQKKIKKKVEFTMK